MVMNLYNDTLSAALGSGCRAYITLVRVRGLIGGTSGADYLSPLWACICQRL